MLMPDWPYKGEPTNNDRWVHRVVLPYKKSGYFVEMGAADGVGGSSCYLFEQIGWRGICVEPSAHFFPVLQRNRPKSVCVNCCVSDRAGYVRFEENRYLSRIVTNPVSEFDRRHRFVPAVTPLQLLREYNAPMVIDYLAVDCEGSDGRILSAFPFGEYTVLAISLEGDPVRPLLERYGYRKVVNPFNTACPWESYYLHESVTSSASGPACPAP